MDALYKIRKVGGDKIAMLGLFIVSLIIARVIVVSRTAILLTEPIRLPRSGLSVSMPDGNGWKSEKQWGYYKNGFALRSIFAPGTGTPAAEARCAYVLEPRITAPRPLFEQKASEIEGEVVKTGQIKKETLIFDYARIQNPQARVIFIFATAALPQNHRLDVEVKLIINDPLLGEQVFSQIIENINYRGNRVRVQRIAQTRKRLADVSLENRKQGRK